MSISKLKLCSCAGLFAVVAALSAGSAVAADAIDPRLKLAMQRDLGLSSAQVSKIVEANRVATSRDAAVRRSLGGNFAGSWIEPTDNGGYRVVAASAGAGSQSGVAGVELRQVKYNLRHLQESMTALDNDAKRRVRGVSKLRSGVHSWYVDPKTNSVVVSVAPDAIDDAIEMVAASGADIGAVRFVTSTRAMKPLSNVVGGNLFMAPAGGEWYFACSIGFAVTQVNQYGTFKSFITAGHCLQTGGATVYLDNSPAGLIEGSWWPGGDIGYVRVDEGHTLSAQVNNYAGGSVPVKGSVEAAIGAAVCRSGISTGYKCGNITAKNVTFDYAEGTVYGLTNTSACSEPGDSGGSFITPDGQAQGVLSGGSGSCSESSFDSGFFPINASMATWNLKLVTQ